ncbi:MAG: hypothetical protein FWE62_05550 [Firmicutes bacterium]|nr:hypothetical protein [Bacillota bacterium]
MEKAKKSGKFALAFKNYFSDFGFRQATGLALIAAAIVLLVGICAKSVPVMVVGLALYAACGLSGVAQSVFVMLKNNKRSPQFKRAVISLVCMAVLLALSVLGIVYAIIEPFKVVL